MSRDPRVDDLARLLLLAARRAPLVVFPQEVLSWAIALDVSGMIYSTDEQYERHEYERLKAKFEGNDQ